MTNTAAHTIADVSTARIICGLLFPAGLSLVILMGGELFTGNCLISISVLEKETTTGTVSYTHLMGSSKRTDFDDARNYGSVLISAREAAEIGVDGILAKIPKAKNYYLTIDIDGFDMSIAPGVASPLPGGLLFDQECDIINGIAKMGRIVAADLVEVDPLYDPSGATVRLASLMMMHVFTKIEEQRKSERRG